MHYISIADRPGLRAKLRKGHKMKVKRGMGFNLIVSPGTYNQVSRAFVNDMESDLELSPDEIEANANLSPDLHQELTDSQQNPQLHPEVPLQQGGSLFHSAKKFLRHPIVKGIANIGKDLLKEELHRRINEQVPKDDIRSRIGHKLIDKGLGGTGLYAGMDGRGMTPYDNLKLANLATAQASHQLAKMHNATVHGMLTQPPIKSYWNEPGEPISRGTGIHMNQIRGRGSLLREASRLPPALQSQPYGANFHMQFQLQPEYKKYNDGTDIEGRGLYA